MDIETKEKEKKKAYYGPIRGLPSKQSPSRLPSLLLWPPSPPSSAADGVVLAGRRDKWQWEAAVSTVTTVVGWYELSVVEVAAQIGSRDTD